jgi:hypothetical protein
VDIVDEKEGLHARGMCSVKGNFDQEVGVLMRAVMLGYWVILMGIVLDILGTIWDVIDDLTGEEALGGLLTPERLKFLGIAVAMLGLVLGCRLGWRIKR